MNLRQLYLLTVVCSDSWRPASVAHCTKLKNEARKEHAMPTPISPQETTVAGTFCINESPGKGPENKNIFYFLQRVWVFTTNSNFLILID